MLIGTHTDGEPELVVSPNPGVETLGGLETESLGDRL